MLNLSYGALYAPGAFVSYDAQEASIINFASSNQAFVAKSAGNDGVAIGSAIPAGTYAGWYDQLAIGLTGAGGAIFVGALSGNGTAGSSADLAYYSNYPGWGLSNFWTHRRVLRYYQLQRKPWNPWAKAKERFGHLCLILRLMRL